MRLAWKVSVTLAAVLVAVTACSYGSGAYSAAPRVSRSYEAPPEHAAGFNTEGYAHRTDNPFLAANANPLSTFSVDVDTASYSNVRRFLTAGQLPPPDAVRLEELVNYFPYDDPAPSTEPFNARIELAAAPWAPDHLLARIGIKGRVIERGARPPANLVFLVDVSGSMASANKLPLLQTALRLLTQQLGEDDRVAIAVYAGASGLALPATSGADKRVILEAIDRFSAGGSTNGAEGIELAYQVAAANFRRGGVNRVILATDGDFNIGNTSEGGLVRLIEEKAKSGVFLTVLGFGMGNYQDSTLELLADKGNGNYAYIDDEAEARKVLVEEVAGTLVTIAKDVKLQVEFNPAHVGAYRLLGYENRLLRSEDFNDDRKDAGEIGAGHTVTALYELVPAGKTMTLPSIDPLKYQQSTQPRAATDELMTVKVRYKEPAGATSQLLSFPVAASSVTTTPGADFRFAAAVASFGMLLRDSPHRGDATFATVSRAAEQSLSTDRGGYRRQFVELVQQASRLKKD